MSSEITRRAQANLATTSTTLTQDVGSGIAELGGLGLAYSVLALLPFIGVFSFIPGLSFVMVFLGLYLRFIR